MACHITFPLLPAFNLHMMKQYAQGQGYAKFMFYVIRNFQTISQRHYAILYPHYKCMRVTVHYFYKHLIFSVFSNFFYLSYYIRYLIVTHSDFNL